MPDAVEIILLDDCSDVAFKNQYLHFVDNPEVKVFFNTENKGRQLSRKKLAAHASFSNLLFLDCDMVIIQNNFIAHYYSEINNGYTVCSGGHVYGNKTPENPSKILHWKYGSSREVKQLRKKNQHFTSGNFLIRKNIFNLIPTLQALGGYGHEDTFWGIWLSSNNYTVKNINNPVLHAGLEDKEVFLKKSMDALMNLKALSSQTSNAVLASHVKLYRWSLLCKKWRISGVVSLCNKRFKKLLLKNLYSAKPSLKIFDFVRLAHFLNIR